jgi:hypothetical protein
MPKRHNNTIYKLSLGIKKTIKAIPSSMTRIGLIVRMEDPKVEETTIADIVITTHSVRSNATFIINLDASQASIQQKINNKYTLSINNMPNM